MDDRNNEDQRKDTATRVRQYPFGPDEAEARAAWRKDYIARAMEETLNHRLQFPMWLNHGLSLKKEMWDRVAGIFDGIVKAKGLRMLDRKRKEFGLLMANLFCIFTVTHGWKQLRISMNDKDYGAGKSLSDFFPDLVRELHKRGIIRMKPGYKNHETGEGRQTRIWLDSDQYVELFGPGLGALEHYIDWSPPQLVQLREKLSDEDRKKGKRPQPILYRITAFTEKLSKKIAFVNRANRTHRVDFQNSKLITDLYAVFNNASWKEGGRLYTSSWWGYQRLSEEERATILIDGEPSRELDYSGLHPRLLYAREGIQYDDDPYKAVFKDEDEEFRKKVLKIVLLAVLNSETEIMAERSGNNMRHLKPEVHDLLKRKGLSVRQILEAFKDAHRPIANHFFSAVGLKVMREDSTIALQILTHFAKKGICCLAIHDSFIVAERHEEELREAMRETYRQHTKGFDCPIK